MIDTRCGGGDGTWEWDSVPKGSGVLVIRRRSDGKAYYAGVRDLRQRAYDHHRLLVLGLHHNRDLQDAWTAAAGPDGFEIAVAEMVHRPDLLPAFKQTWIERFRDNGFNRKNSVRCD